VIGIDADEAEFLAEFLDRDECAPAAQQASPHQGMLLAEPAPLADSEYTSSALLGAPVSHSGPVPLGGGQIPLGGGQIPLGGGQYPPAGQGPLPGSQFPLGAQIPRPGGPLPLGLRRPVTGPAEIPAELVGWQSGELPGQAAERLG